MILIKYVIYYSFIGVYQTKLSVQKLFLKTSRQFDRLNKIKNNEGEITAMRTTLLRTAFRSIL
jgi:hypothetical protein